MPLLTGRAPRLESCLERRVKVYIRVSQKLGVPFLGVPIIRTIVIVYWGLYWGCPILENYHIGVGIYRAGVGVTAEPQL